MDIQEKLYTAADLVELSAQGKRYELIRGELSDMSPANETHGELANWIAYLITSHVYANGLGRVYTAETGFTLFEDPDTVLAPDVAFISTARLKPRTYKYGKVAPDLAVEVVSPSNTKTELHEKIVLYFEAGTRQVWVVYPKSKAIYVYTASDNIRVLNLNATLDGADILPNFKVAVHDLFSILDK